MSKTEDYRQELRELESWDEFLLQESGLPGPRGNLELAQVVADEGDAALFERYLGYTADLAPVNSPYEFLAFCGVVGLGRLLAGGELARLDAIRGCAADPRWRMREGVAMALQRLGDVDMELLIREMQIWSAGSLLEQRAAAAALCEPRLLRQPDQARQVLDILDKITAGLPACPDRKHPDFQALRKGLGYCWSVAIVAAPDYGKKLFEKWLSDPDKDVRWVMQENLKKNRLLRLDAAWVEQCKSR
jgi:hypothetical protein